MKFVPTEKLKIGMRLAKPIYNKTGVMLYERDTKLTSQGIESIKNFDLIGIYILEEAEPLPPLTEEDREFERFQTVSVFSLKEILTTIKAGKKPDKLETLVLEITKRFGDRKGKITFTQNLRSPEDTVYKHSLNVAILSAVIASKLELKGDTFHDIIVAALLHDIGSLDIPKELLMKPQEELTEEEVKRIYKFRDDGYKDLRDVMDLNSNISKNISYLLRDIKDLKNSVLTGGKKVDSSVEVLKVAYTFDNLTAMKYGQEPKSDIEAYKAIKQPGCGLNSTVVRALTKAIYIVPVGCSVQFENGEKGIVLTENTDDILRPFILNFSDNTIHNLIEGKEYEKYQIKDVLKTLDNRYIMTDKYEEYLKQLNAGEVK